MRQISVLDHKVELNLVYPSNYISNCKYSRWKYFIPMNLMEQLIREEIIWFFFISLMQLLPFNLSPLSNWGTISPLCLIILVSMVKDGYNTWKILKSDENINKQKANVIEDFEGKIKTVNWENIKVGSFVVIYKNEPCPADAILLSSSDNGQAFVETSNLDGEIRFQKKESIEITNEVFGSSLRVIKDKIKKFKDSQLKVEQPNNALYKFEGRLKLKDYNEEILINVENVVLRGSKIKNVEHVLGLVVYTGPDTKLMQNSRINKRKKYTKVQKRLRKFVLFILIEIVLLALLSTLMSLVTFYKNGEKSIYAEDLQDIWKNILTFLILYNNLVPISLYVTLDFSKLVQAWFIVEDRELLTKNIEDRKVSVKNSDLNEELGQIQYIFTDKTGTLTKNQMELKKCWIKGEYFLNDALNNVTENSLFNLDFTCLNVETFWMCVALCHTAKLDTNNTYKSESPDEIALVSAAAKFGYTFMSDNHDLFQLKTPQSFLGYSVIAINKYSPERKRMSVVVKFYESHNIPPILICKGADNAIIPLLDANCNTEGLNEAVTDLAKEGLRTLVYAFRYLTESELKTFDRRYKDAMNPMADTETSLKKLAEDFEKNLELVGVSGVEDKVIEGVAETIETLKEAGIKFWLMTGDKKETAENVAHLSNIIERDSKIIYLEDIEINLTLQKLIRQLLTFLYPHKAAYEGFNELQSVTELENTLENLQITDEITEEVENFSIVVYGDTLSMIFENKSALKYFTLLSTFAYSVICCRTVPFQKAQVVKLIKDHLSFRPSTLAIGDGSNDVSMIQEANVGVGIMGREGMQAANSADYAINNFTQLTRLLLFHGRNNYSRTCKLIILSFFKNFLVILPLHYYSYISYYSGTCLYDAWLIMTYNIIMTSLPIVIIGVMEKEKKIIGHAGVYKIGIKSLLLNWKVFFYWKFFAIFASVLLFLLVIMLSKYSLNSESFSLNGTLLFIIAVLTSLGVFMVEMNEWNKFFLGSIFFSLIALMAITIGYDYSGFPTTEIKNVIKQIIIVPNNFLLLILVPLIIITISLFSMFFSVKTLKSGTSSIYPDPVFRRNRYKIFPQTKNLRKYSKNILGLFRIQNIESLIKKVLNERRDDFKRSSLTQVFQNSQIETEYIKFKAERSIFYVRCMLGLILLGNISWTVYGIYTFIMRQVFDKLVVRLFLLIITIFATLFSTHSFFLDHFERCLIIMIVGGLCAKTAVEFQYNLDGSMSTATGAIIIFIIFHMSIHKVIFIWSLFLTIYLIRITIMYSESSSITSVEILIVHYFIILIGISFITGYTGYTIEDSNRETFVMAKKYDERYSTGRRIKSRLLPRDVINDIEKKNNIVKESYVTLMFCEILNFDRIVTDLPREELMQMLNKYTLMMDNLCENKKVTKIETVNKTYVACCGLNGQQNHAATIVELAVDIINKFRPYKVPKIGCDFQLRIGINTGNVISGVVGEHKPQYCLVGDTMNIASRMCSTITTGNRIRISDTTFNNLKNKESWSLEEEFISFKGRQGPVKTHFVESLRHPVERFSSEFGNVPVDNLLKENRENHDRTTPRRTLSMFDIESIKTDDFKRSETSFFLIQNNDEEYLFSEEIQWNVLIYYENLIQERYRENFITRNKGSIRNGLLMNLFVNVSMEVTYICHYSIIADEQQVIEIFCIIIRGVVILVLLVIYLCFDKIVKRRSYQWLIVIVFTFKNLVEVLSSLIKLKVHYILILETMYTAVAINHISGLLYGYILAGSSIQCILWILAARKGLITYFDQLFFIIFFIIINLVASRAREYFDRQTYKLILKAKASIQRTEKLLKQMIPEPVYRNLAKGQPILDYFENIPILYADICGFTAFSTHRFPQDIIRILSKLFTSFEKYTIENNSYKVHTIGDCYVALGVNYTFSGADNSSIFNTAKGTENILKLALKMVKKLKKSKNLNMLKMRIGIHTGNVIAGIVGTKIVRYDIYGKDVDITNLVESAGVAGKINVSESTKKILDTFYSGKYRFVDNKKVVHKPSETELRTYLLEDSEDT